MPKTWSVQTRKFSKPAMDVIFEVPEIAYTP